MIWECSLKKQLLYSSNYRNLKVIPNQVPHICLLRASNPSRFLNCVRFYFNFSTQKVKITIKKQIYMYLNFADLKIEIFRDFRVFIFSPIFKNKHWEVTEIHQNPQNTDIWECNFKKYCSSDIILKIIQPPC